MKCAFLWKAFEETGDPLCYLFYKSFSQADEAGKTENKGSRERLPV